MKVVHINKSDKGGGAAIAAYRHHEAMRSVGIDSKMLVLQKQGEDANVVAHKTSNISRFCWKVFNKLFIMRYRYYATWSLSLLGYDVADDEVVKSADVIYMHWVNGGMLSVHSIEKILKLNKPVYWFMHDMWPITGGCHHSLSCVKYQSHCGKCEMAHNRKGSRFNRDFAYIQFEQKFKHLSKYKNLHFLTPSQWLADRVKESALFGDHDVQVWRNVLDTDVFKPQDKLEARNRLGLPLDKKLILFGADNISSVYKGWPYLKDALQSPIEDAECVVYGACDVELQSQVSMPVHSLGKISSLDRLIDLYSACDVFVTPSLADNYPNVIVEAMACGLPVVGFATGGIPEMINDGKDGILVHHYDSAELRAAVIKVLNDTETDYAANAMAKVRATNSYENGVIRPTNL